MLDETVHIAVSYHGKPIMFYQSPKEGTAPKICVAVQGFLLQKIDQAAILSKQLSVSQVFENLSINDSNCP